MVATPPVPKTDLAPLSRSIPFQKYLERHKGPRRISTAHIGKIVQGRDNGLAALIKASIILWTSS